MGAADLSDGTPTPAALASLTNGAIKQTGIVDVAQRCDSRAGDWSIWRRWSTGPGRRATRSRANMSWMSAVRVHERSILDVISAEIAGHDQSSATRSMPGDPILLRVTSGKGTIDVLNVWLRNGDQSARIASMMTMLKGIEGAENYDFQRWPYFNWLLYATVAHGGGRAGHRPTATGSRRRCPIARNSCLAAIFLPMFAMFVVRI